MQKLTRKLITLSTLIVALAALSFSPAPKSTKCGIDVFCLDGPISDDCPTGKYCCDLSGNCTCGGS